MKLSLSPQQKTKPPPIKTKQNRNLWAFYDDFYNLEDEQLRMSHLSENIKELNEDEFKELAKLRKKNKELEEKERGLKNRLTGIEKKYKRTGLRINHYNQKIIEFNEKQAKRFRNNNNSNYNSQIWRRDSVNNTDSLRKLAMKKWEHQIIMEMAQKSKIKNYHQRKKEKQLGEMFLAQRKREICQENKMKKVEVQIQAQMTRIAQQNRNLKINKSTLDRIKNEKRAELKLVRFRKKNIKQLSVISQKEEEDLNQIETQKNKIKEIYDSIHEASTSDSKIAREEQGSRLMEEQGYEKKREFRGNKSLEVRDSKISHKKESSRRKIKKEIKNRISSEEKVQIKKRPLQKKQEETKKEEKVQIKKNPIQKKQEEIKKEEKVEDDGFGWMKNENNEPKNVPPKKIEKPKKEEVKVEEEDEFGWMNNESTKKEEKEQVKKNIDTKKIKKENKQEDKGEFDFGEKKENNEFDFEKKKSKQNRKKYQKRKSLNLILEIVKPKKSMMNLILENLNIKK